MKLRSHRWYNAVLAALLSMLGYGCSSSDEPVEYGTPHADYMIKGQVTGKIESDSNVFIEKESLQLTL